MKSHRCIVKAMVDRTEREETKIRMTEAAMADVDQSRLIAHAEMLAWAESLDTTKPLCLPE